MSGAGASSSSDGVLQVSSTSKRGSAYSSSTDFTPDKVNAIFAAADAADVSATGIETPDPIRSCSMLTIPRNGLKTTSLGHGRTKLAVPATTGDKLGIAAENNDMIKVQKLIRRGVSVNCKNAGSGVTPLGVSAERGHLEMCKLLISVKADINEPTNEGLTPLHISAQFGMTEVVRALVQAKAEVNTTCLTTVPTGNTPLIAATVRNSLSTIEVLLEAQADVNLMAPKAKGNALHLACELGWVELGSSCARVRPLRQFRRPRQSLLPAPVPAARVSPCHALVPAARVSPWPVTWARQSHFDAREHDSRVCHAFPTGIPRR
jgi:hypothetical protein